MRFFCLHQGLNADIAARLAALRRASERQRVDFVPLDSLAVDYSALPNIVCGDILYNCARGSEALESLLLSPSVTTFYREQPDFIVPVDTINYALINQKHGLAAPRTVFCLSQDRSLLRRYVEYLGGFPVILKSRGGTCGVGTIKCDNFASLFSVTDYICSLDQQFVLRQYISNQGTARIVVLGDEVIATEFRDNLQDDFRVSGISGERNYYAKKFEPGALELAIHATKICNLDTAGVDIVFDSFGIAYVLEVNCPHNFIPPQTVTGVDIADAMVRWLCAKSHRLMRSE
jgi:hypothetical protein